MASSLLSHSPSRGRAIRIYRCLSSHLYLKQSLFPGGEERGGGDGGSSKGDNLGVRDECSSEDDGGAEAAWVKVKEIAVDAACRSPWKPQNAHQVVNFVL